MIIYHVVLLKKLKYQIYFKYRLSPSVPSPPKPTFNPLPKRDPYGCGYPLKKRVLI
jgi:hypothetical protein